MTYVVQLVVETAGVADGVTVRVPSPQGGGGGVAVGATCPSSSGGGLKNTLNKFLNQ
jgi:hypothetical protein